MNNENLHIGDRLTEALNEASDYFASKFTVQAETRLSSGLKVSFRRTIRAGAPFWEIVWMSASAADWQPVKDASIDTRCEVLIDIVMLEEALRLAQAARHQKGETALGVFEQWKAVRFPGGVR